MVKWALLLAVLLFLMVAQPAVADSPSGNGSIGGSLINKTASTTSSVSDQMVNLKIYSGATPIDSKTTRTSSEGKFLFEGLSTDPAYVYRIDVNYLQVDYASDILQFSSGETTKSVDIPVYDTSTTGDTVSVAAQHVIISKDNNSLSITEYFSFFNHSDHTFIGSTDSNLGIKNVTLKLNLPPDSINFQSGYGMAASDIVKQGNYLYSTTAVTPEGTDISYSYQLLLKDDSQTLSWTMNYNVSQFDILLDGVNLTVSNSKIVNEPALTYNGKTYGHYSSQRMVRGDIITARVVPASTGSKLNLFSWVWLLLIIPIAAVVAMFLIRRKKSQVVTADNAYQQIKEGLLAEIVELDDTFESGKIEEQEYQKLRAQKKQDLVKMMEIMEVRGDRP